MTFLLIFLLMFWKLEYLCKLLGLKLIFIG